MKNRNCPNKDMCWDYNESRCEGCAVGEKIARFARQNKKLEAENAELRHRAEVYEEMFDILYETSEDMKFLSKEWYKHHAEKKLAEERKDG